MKSMPLYKLKKKSSSYFKKLGVVSSKGRTRKQVEYITERTLYSLPKNLKEFLSKEDKARIKRQITNDIMAGSDIDIYSAISSYAKGQKRRSGGGTSETIWREFKKQASNVYNQYNSYIYRQGHSASKYYFDNVELSQEGSIVTATVDFPYKATGKSYEYLLIEYDFSGGEVMTALMVE